MKGSITLPDVRVELCAATQDVRWYLNWPYLDLREPGQPMLVATDGHKLLAAPVEVSGELESCALPLEAFQAARQGPSPHCITFDGEMCGTDEAMFRIPGRENQNGFKYPLWRNVAKDAPKTKPAIGINAASLDTLHKALGGDKYHGITLAFTTTKDGDTDPARLVRVRHISHSKNDEAVIAILMPMRIE